MSRTIISAALSKLAMIGVATSVAFAPVALAPMAATAQPAAEAAPKLANKAAAAKVLECSKEARAKGLHGKPSQKFVLKCEKGQM